MPNYDDIRDPETCPPSKGGQNKPTPETARPPAPQGSGGTPDRTKVFVLWEVAFRAAESPCLKVIGIYWDKMVAHRYAAALKGDSTDCEYCVQGILVSDS